MSETDPLPIPILAGRASLLVLLGLMSPSLTADDVGHEEALRLREQGLVLPFETVLDAIHDRYPEARLLEVELERDDGILVYEIELLTRERVVRELEIDARDGTWLDDERDD
ncbi:hypothetical protein T9A_01532 [Alcanivorax jadensis T9]|jgi:uncharacterized membrane protein YkoI|uniref:PepSY domain-containing protein n=1 Tax=Alcanivorax jadensis T9 TaxID=1177181 RepID=A0ABR4WDN6_9GAMM|nr:MULTISPECIES: PepSY domain-containing protein [Alcanivorax]KGD61583.1 hypothetical protein T9A_01532 [Alcanivorax jadensis T9]|tara:strand:+ start:167 stop:502 length:336 start_codon:yes stop_codon:yes gene_type:complete